MQSLPACKPFPRAPPASYSRPYLSFLATPSWPLPPPTLANDSPNQASFFDREWLPQNIPPTLRGTQGTQGTMHLPHHLLVLCPFHLDLMLYLLLVQPKSCQLCLRGRVPAGRCKAGGKRTSH